MSKPIIGLVDYGAGNCASVKRLISKLGYRSRLIDKPEDFELISVLFFFLQYPSFMNRKKSIDQQTLLVSSPLLLKKN